MKLRLGNADLRLMCQGLMNCTGMASARTQAGAVAILAIKPISMARSCTFRALETTSQGRRHEKVRCGWLNQIG